MAAGMSIVVVIFFVFVIRFLWNLHEFGQGFFTHPFYNPATFSFKSVFHGTSVAVLTYIGFDAISTFSEEVENPRRNIMLATVLVCLITGVLASLEVYAAQLVWRDQPFPADKITSAFPLVAQTAGGYFLFQLINFTILIANIGSGMGSQLGAARLLYGMGRSNGIPKKFFGAIDPKSHIPRNNVIFVGADRAGRRISHYLRSGRGSPEFRRSARFHGRQHRRAGPLLPPRRRKKYSQSPFATSRFPDLRLHLEPA